MSKTEIHYMVANRWKTPDGTLLWSKHRHDYVSHTDAVTGLTYAIDGGSDYTRLIGKSEDLIDLCVYNTNTIEEIREVFHWGSYGKNGDECLHYILLKDLTEEHINAVLRTQTQLGTWVKDLFIRELEYRNLNTME